MKRFTAVKEIEFDYGHRIQDHKSKCRQLHGHRGKLEVHVSGPLQTCGSSNGMVLDFGDIKTVLCKLHDVWDHGLILEGTDPLLMFLNNSKLADFQAIGFGKLFVFDCPPTAENLAAYALQFLKEALEHNGVSVDRVVFWETPTSRAIIDKDWPGSPMPLQTSEWKMPEPRIEWQP